MPRTLHRYIIRELCPAFVVGLFAAVFIILATKMLSITELIVAQGVRASQVAGMVLYLTPDILSFALPAASLMAVVVGFLRLSADNEIIAMKSCGISLYQMLPPVLLLAGMGLVLGFSVSLLAVPWGNRSFKDLLFRIAESKADLGIRERIFSEPFDNVVFYVNSFSPREKVMQDVFVVDRRDPQASQTIVAEQARVFLQSQHRKITLHFLKGSIFVAGKEEGSDRTVQFETYDLNIGLRDIMAGLSGRRKGPKEMSARELLAAVGGNLKPKKRREMLIELNERLSIPVAVFLMAVIGVPLGAQLRARGRTAGIAVSLCVFLVYYLCLAAARSVCETGVVPPGVGTWVPDLFLLAACAYLLRRAAREMPFFGGASRALTRAGLKVGLAR